ncbi:sulfurtransferase complex subunit TusC [Thalassotalea sp. G2M2-11]|uniref:sulfurtransferase complex subunit TusC n=1 Tax=Thalassotalea sp. G2M2-11 TaxID=2787627 RepID=UPI0019D292D6|nr:sulfurtransferase complex subunit TusC [Thalassotalea sp. G2M2-11]
MIKTEKSIALLNTTAPFASPNAKDALDIAMIMGSFEQPTYLFFAGDGVWQLKSKQDPSKINVKDFLKTFSAFEFYDIEDIYVCQQSLDERGLAADFHIKNVQLLSTESFSHQLKQHHTVLTF